MTGIRERFGDDFWLVKKYDRDLECEHRDVMEDGALDPCTLEAEFAVNTPMEDDVTRSRFCSIHIWDSIERYLAVGSDHNE